MVEEHSGTWTYDSLAEAAYVYLRGPIPPNGVARTVTAEGAMVNLDLDADGRVIGIEILGLPDSPRDDSGVSGGPGWRW